MPLTKKKKLGEILVEKGLINSRQLNEALGIQDSRGQLVEGALTEQGIANREKLNKTAGFEGPSVKMKTDLQLLKIIPEQLIRKYDLFPIKIEGKRIFVAMTEPINVLAIDDLRIMTGFEIEPVIKKEKEIKASIEKHFGIPEVEEAIKELGIDNDQAGLFEINEDQIDRAPIIRLVNSLIIKAIEEEASDIHIEPFEQTVRVRYRTDGILREVMNFPRKMIYAVVSRVKVMADMDIAERRMPQDGRVPIKLRGREMDLRISTMPTVFGEKAVVRILDKGSIKDYTLEKLGLSEFNLKRFKNFMKSNSGMLLVTGPTGSGKTTTLYTALYSINSTDKNIITVEDPVEYMLQGINQSQVNVKAGATFATYLRSILRQDPDVILVGEIRDLETAEIAIRASTTGHLVLSTLHTNDAPGALTRLIDMGIEPFMVASSVLGTVSQRLVRRVCENCKRERVPDQAEVAFAGIHQDTVIYYGAGCDSCNKSGYRGRIAVYEVLLLSASLQDLILHRAPAGEIRRAAIKEGMVTLKEDGIKKALEGVTTIKEIMRVAYREEME